MLQRLECETDEQAAYAPFAQTSPITMISVSIDEAVVFAIVVMRSQIEPIFIVVLAIPYS